MLCVFIWFWCAVIASSKVAKQNVLSWAYLASSSWQMRSKNILEIYHVLVLLFFRAFFTISKQFVFLYFYFFVHSYAVTYDSRWVNSKKLFVPNRFVDLMPIISIANSRGFLSASSNFGPDNLATFFYVVCVILAPSAGNTRRFRIIQQFVKRN